MMAEESNTLNALTPGGQQPFGEDVCSCYDDARFRTVKKHKVREVEAPAPPLEAPIADTHVHLSMLRDPVRALARSAVHGVGFVCCIANPVEDADVVYSQIDGWFDQAADAIGALDPACGNGVPAYRIACGLSRAGILCGNP